MATITTFSTLKTAVADWLDRDDMSAASGDSTPIDTMIALAEDKIYRELRLNFMEAATSPSIVGSRVTVPTDFLEAIEVSITEGGMAYSLQQKSFEWIIKNYPTRSSSGRPKFYAISRSFAGFGPYPDSTYQVNFVYYAKPTRLSTANETNWLTSNATDLLLNETLLQSIGFLGNDERAVYWKAERDRIMAALNREKMDRRFAPEKSLQATPA